MTIPETPQPGQRYMERGRVMGDGAGDHADCWAVWQRAAVQGDPDRCVAAGLGEADARLLVFGSVLLAALRRCEVSMDTAALLGVGGVLPPAYRDSWALVHTAARAALAHFPEQA